MGVIWRLKLSNMPLCYNLTFSYYGIFSSRLDQKRCKNPDELIEKVLAGYTDSMTQGGRPIILDVSAVASFARVCACA